MVGVVSNILGLFPFCMHHGCTADNTERKSVSVRIKSSVTPLPRASLFNQNTAQLSRPSSVCSLYFRGINMLGEGEESEIQKRMSSEMSLVWLLLSSSAQWSLPPGESAVWIKPLMAGANGAAADRAHPTSVSCHLSTGGGR